MILAPVVSGKNILSATVTKSSVTKLQIDIDCLKVQ